MLHKPKMTNVASVLETKASGSLDIQDDLDTPQGKTIAELLYEQEQTPQEKEQNKTSA